MTNIITTHERNNAMQQLYDMRQRDTAGRVQSGNAIADILHTDGYREWAANGRQAEPVPDTVQPLTHSEALKYHDIPRLDDLTADHMSQAQQTKFNALLATVRQWRNEWTEGRSLVLASPRFGIGKTHIAKALAASFDTLAIVGGTETALINGRPNWQIMKRSKVITARQFMDALDKGQQVTTRNTRVLVLDDLGREGNIEYVAKENQIAEIQSRYFELINYCNDMQISLIVTTNHRVSEIPSLIGEASWSRLQGMAPRGYILELGDYPDMRVKESGR